MALVSADIELVHAARAGDVAALGTLLERHRAPLYAAALSILGDYAQAQDVVHDAFVIALRQLADLRDPAAVGGWLHAIVRNGCRMHLRSLRKTADIGEPHSIVDALDIDRSLEEIALRDWVWTAIDRLPEDLGATVMLRYFSRNASYAEIAATLDIPVGTVRSRLNAARRSLTVALSATASTTHGDHAALLRERRSWWRSVIDEIEHDERATIYADGCAPDVVVEADGVASRTRGIDQRASDVVDTLRLGVGVHLSGIVASSSVTILEIDFANPPAIPDLCPPKHTEVRFHAGETTTRINLSYQHAPVDAMASGG